MTGLAYQERAYRSFGAAPRGRVAFEAQIGTSDLYIRADRDLSREALTALRTVRGHIEDHVAERPAFATALEPLEAPAGVPAVVEAMYAAGRRAGVGPLAAVAGAVAGEVGRALRRWTREVLVENGGDIYADVAEESVIGLFAGPSPLSGRVGLRLAPEDTPVGICTSSGTVGPSLSFGKADAATVVARDPALADAVATALGNRIRSSADLEPAVSWAMAVPGVLGAVAILGDRLAAMGAVELVPIGS